MGETEMEKIQSNDTAIQEYEKKIDLICERFLLFLLALCVFGAMLNLCPNRGMMLKGLTGRIPGMEGAGLIAVSLLGILCVNKAGRRKSRLWAFAALLIPLATTAAALYYGINVFPAILLFLYPLGRLLVLLFRYYAARRYTEAGEVIKQENKYQKSIVFFSGAIMLFSVLSCLFGYFYYARGTNLAAWSEFSSSAIYKFTVSAKMPCKPEEIRLEAEDFSGGRIGIYRSDALNYYAMVVIAEDAVLEANPANKEDVMEIFQKYGFVLEEAGKGLLEEMAYEDYRVKAEEWHGTARIIHVTSNSIAAGVVMGKDNNEERDITAFFLESLRVYDPFEEYYNHPY